MMWLIVSLTHFLTSMLTHALASRLLNKGTAVLKFVLVGSLIGLSLIGNLFSKYGLSVQFWAGIFLYALICEIYIFLFTLVGTSVSAKLLRSLLGGKMSKDQIDQIYDTSGMVQVRLSRLRKAGLIEQDPGLYLVTEEGKKIVRSFLKLKKFFGHTRSF